MRAKSIKAASAIQLTHYTTLRAHRYTHTAREKFAYGVVWLTLADRKYTQKTSAFKLTFCAYFDRVFKMSKYE